MRSVVFVLMVIAGLMLREAWHALTGRAGVGL